MGTSILTNTKKVLGVDEGYTAFDADILMHINSAFSTLNQIGIGPEAGFAIEDAVPTWSAFLGNDLRLNSVKLYVYLRARVIFDPPSTSFVLAALKEQIQELEWRLNVQRESTGWVNPNPVAIVPIYDGGTP